MVAASYHISVYPKKYKTSYLYPLFFFAFISRERPLQMQALFSVFILTNVACMAPKMFQDYYYGGTHTH